MNFLFEKVENAPLIVFRIFFGLLMMAECWGAIATGWVNETFVEPQFTFTFIGMEWTQFLIGETMIYVYVFMGILGLLITIGAFYRISTILFCLVWGMTYLMQKTHYNNHYYLVWIISFFMIFVPANRYLSVDANMNSKIRSQVTPRWALLIFMIQVSIVYFFAAIAKLYPGWIENKFLALRMRSSAHWFEKELGWNSFAEFLKNEEFTQFLSYSGIAFDFLIVPLLLFKPTRKIAFISALLFHIFNAVTLHIGIFPFFALALCLFFFPREDIRRWFLPFKGRIFVDEKDSYNPFWQRATLIFFTLFFVWQIYLPMRHWLIPGDVLWTEEGHRLSWRMMLRAKGGTAQFEVHIPKENRKIDIELGKYLAPHQIGDMKVKPDLMWQFAQKLKDKFNKKGIDSVEVYVKGSKLSINGGPFHDYIDPNVDLANEKWSYFGHQSWILPQPSDYHSIEKKVKKKPE